MIAYKETFDKIMIFVLTHEIAILNWFSILMFIIGFVVYIILQYQPATYGRYSATGRFYSVQVPAKIAWFLQEVPAFLIPFGLVLLGYYEMSYHQYDTSQLLVLSCFILHYFQRSFIYPLCIVGGKPTPLYAFLLAFIFCAVNGYMQARGALLLSTYPHDIWTTIRLVVGITLFIFGFLSNLHSDHVLRNLRKPGETGYKIPRGGLFTYVSCGNFLGEIIEWFGFAVASWSCVAFAFSFFTACNLVPRAMCHHRFYQEKFDDYPKTRKAVIPFIL